MKRNQTLQLSPKGIASLKDFAEELMSDAVTVYLESNMYYVVRGSIHTTCVFDTKLTHQEILNYALADINEALKGNLLKTHYGLPLFGNDKHSKAIVKREHFTTPAQRALERMAKRINNYATK